MFPPEKPRRKDNSGGWEEPRRQLIFGKDFLLPSFHPLFCLYFSPTERNNKKKFPIKDLPYFFEADLFPYMTSNVCRKSLTMEYGNANCEITNRIPNGH